MTETYTKLFGSIIHSTIWREPDHVRLVWVTMLALADQHGCVWASLPGLADAARVTIEQCEDALARFHKPDRHSRSKANDGRRVETVDRGWRLLNHATFRAMRSAAERTEANREYKRKSREKTRLSAPSQHVSHGQPKSAHAEASASPEASASQIHKISERDCEGGDVASLVPNPSLPFTDGRKRRPKAPSKDPMGQQIVTAATWDGYKQAYQARYGAEPIRNAKVNGQVAHFCTRVPHSEAPSVAAYYLLSNNARYVASGHAWGPLVQDAEKLRTEWATGRSGTVHAAQQADKQQSKGADMQALIEKLKREERLAAGEST